MANGLLAVDNLIDTATLSGGSWLAGAPLTNIAYPTRLSKKARSSDDLKASTQYIVDHGKSYPAQVFASLYTNLSTAALCRVTRSDESDFSVLTYDSGWFDVFPAIYPSSQLAWEDANWWTGKPTEAQVNAYKRNMIHIADAQNVARYTKYEFDDENNPDGFVDIGRGLEGRYWQFTKNFSFGLRYIHEVNTLKVKGPGGSRFYDERPNDRGIEFSLELMENSEAFGRAYDMIRQKGISKEVLFVKDPDDKPGMFRTSFLGTFEEMNPLEEYVHELHRQNIRIMELQ